jgi:hypothetical protein
MQKYRLDAVSKSDCSQECECVNIFQLYPSFLPENINNSLQENTPECKKPCSRVTRSHVHAYAMPSRCALVPFVELFKKDINQKLYHILEGMKIEQYLTITNEKSMYLFGGFSAMMSDDDMTNQIERGLTTIFLYALRTEKFLSNIDLFDFNELSSELKEEIQYAKACFGF